MDLYRTLGSVARSNQPELAALLDFGETSLLVTGFKPLFLGKDPYLQQVHGFDRGRIRLAVANATPRGHALPVSRKDHRASAQAVFVLKLARQDIGDDLHVAMRVGRETAAGRNPIFIDHAQRAEAHPLRIGVIVKTESMARLQPAVVAAATLIARSDGHHGCSLPVSRCNDDCNRLDVRETEGMQWEPSLVGSRWSFAVRPRAKAAMLHLLVERRASLRQAQGRLSHVAPSSTSA